MNPTSEPIRNYRIRLLWAGFAFLYLVIALLPRMMNSTAPDEVGHYGQINLFDHGDFRVADKYLTMLPGYHAIAAAILWATDMRSLAAARVLNALFGLFTIGAFHLLRKRAWGEADAMATLQFAVLPILFPYNFLVYTDVLSLGLVLAAAAATLRERDLLAGLLMLVALTVRQTNVIWLPLLAAIALWPKWQIPSPPQIVRKTLPYLTGIALFVAYWIWNGHISLSKEQAVMHPDWSVHVGNIYFTLFLCGLLFPLQVIAGSKGFVAQLRESPWLGLIPVAVFVLYWALFRVDHPYNEVTDPVVLHNRVILLTQSSLFFKAVFGLVAVAAACGLANTRLRPPAAVLLYPLAVLALAAFWMIEHRYALIPLSLWLAFRERQSSAIENATTALWAIFAVCSCLGIFSGRFSL